MYPATLLKSFISCNSWWKQLVVQKFGGFSKCSFTSFAESNSFASCLIVLKRTFNTMLNKRDNSENLLLIISLRGNAYSLSPLNIFAMCCHVC